MLNHLYTVAFLTGAVVGTLGGLIAHALFA